MPFTIATRGKAELCRIEWSMCRPEAFREDPAFLEARDSDLVETVEDLAVFLDQCDVLAYLDTPRVMALLEINRCLIPVEPNQRPRIYYESDGTYHMLEFHPGKSNMMRGYLPDVHHDCFDVYTYTEFELMVPELHTWVVVPLKSVP